MRCYHTATGPWQCTCEPPNTNRMYVIDGAVGLDACAIGAALCAGAAPTPALDAESCVLWREETGQVGGQTCTVESQCQTSVPVDFAPGVRITMPGVGVVDCIETAWQPQPSSPQSAMRVDCKAAGSLGAESYAVVANGVASACRPLVDFYLRSEQPDFDGSKACIDEVHDEDLPDSCHFAERCFDSAPLSNGVSIVKEPPTTRGTFCGFDDLGSLSCGCTFESGAGNGVALSYELGPAMRPATCDLSGCTLEMRAEPTGPGDCRAQLDSAEHDDDSCLSYFSCRQPATLAGREVTIRSQLNARCARGADQVFYCGCAAGDQTAAFSVGNLATGVDACEAVGTACLERLTLPLGPHPTAGPLPDPLLGL
jgi:hypothetical protein